MPGIDLKMKEVINRKARFEYHFLQKYTAGMQLTGTEVKSIRLGNANLNDAYCYFKGVELFIRSMFIAEYEQGSIHNHETRRDRKLLLKKAELKKLYRRVNDKGLTIVPYKLFLSDRGLIKIEIALARGKKEYDKRQAIKERENKRNLQRIMREKDNVYRKG